MRIGLLVFEPTPYKRMVDCAPQFFVSGRAMSSRSGHGPAMLRAVAHLSGWTTAPPLSVRMFYVLRFGVVGSWLSVRSWWVFRFGIGFGTIFKIDVPPLTRASLNVLRQRQEKVDG